MSILPTGFPGKPWFTREF